MKLHPLDKSKAKDTTPELNHKACQGQLCPECLSTNVKHVGSNPDGFNMNHAYDCQDCGCQWEGY